MDLLTCPVGLPSAVPQPQLDQLLGLGLAGTVKDQGDTGKTFGRKICGAHAYGGKRRHPPCPPIHSFSLGPGPTGLRARPVLVYSNAPCRCSPKPPVVEFGGVASAFALRPINSPQPKPSGCGHAHNPVPHPPKAVP
jgi:hypothetical protein